jgi:hypothetical protein
MITIRFKTMALAGTALVLLLGGPVLAADVSATATRAVAAPNGKVELGGGWAGLSHLGNDADIYGGASFSMPMGDRLGMQADFSVQNVWGDTMTGGNLHLFTRDPDRYLFGVVAGGGGSDHASLFYVAPEMELYLGNVSLETWGGYVSVDKSGSPAKDKFFIQSDLAFYATDNLRLTIGGSSVAGFDSGHVGVEYLIDSQQMPIALTANAQVGDNKFAEVTGGLSIYFGGESKSLIRRHREDDPRNRSLSLFSGIGNGLTKSGPTCDFDPETPLPPCPD